ncbi:molybdopterin-guanine dinucleotide biosynthesis protein B [Paenibacillus piri]|uniref:Molybdopterin-guanine dinucleotide biosynthesis protein B n=1 Tax=Paenibacillus piri TaxID=2547395 RepID=A0A4R5KM79_9BACL|nr:molybdopterin-guanine dinucleotide biosynthesis protein B [Paenibacillus piri]
MTTVIGFAGFSNSGKTTLIAALVNHFAQRGLRTAVIKHDAHGHYKEAAGTDSALYREAGASATAVLSPESSVLYYRGSGTLEQMIGLFAAGRSFELILIEGFKSGTHDKIALFRNEEQADIMKLLPEAPAACAAPSDMRKLAPAAIPFLDLNDIGAVAAWIEERMNNNCV